MFNIKVLSQEDTKRLLSFEEVISEVEGVYLKKARGQTNVYPLVFHEFEPQKSDMDIKSGDIIGDVFGLKMVSWFSANEKKGLPALIGTILVCDARSGVPLGVVDGGHITGIRTGAAAALGAKYLARKESETLLMVGAGHISSYAIAASISLLPRLKTIYLSSVLFPENEVSEIEKLKKKLDGYGVDYTGVEILPAINLEQACKKSDIIITATPSRSGFIKKPWIKEGTHLSCIGADMTGKQELDVEVLEGATIYVDDLSQCVEVGEVENAIKKGRLSVEDICGGLGELIDGSSKGRTTKEEISVFDATGMALLDLAVAKLALEKAKAKGVGTTAEL